MLESLVIMAGLLFGQVEISDSAKTYIYVSPDPPGAVVVLDGEPLGKANVLVEVSPGEHNVTMTLRGFKMENLKVSVRAGTIARVVRKLQPDFEWLIGELLRAEDKRPILDILAALGAGAEPAVPALIDLFEQSDLELRAAVGQSLEKIGKPAASPLAGLAESEDVYLRLMAARFLAHIGPDAVPAILNLVGRVDKDHVGRAGNRSRLAQRKSLFPSDPVGHSTQLAEWREEELPDSVQVILEELAPDCIPTLLRDVQMQADSSDDAAFVLSRMQIPGEYAEETLATVADALEARAQIKLQDRSDDSELASFLEATTHLPTLVPSNLLPDEATTAALRRALVLARPDPNMVIEVLSHHWPKGAARDLVPELIGMLKTAGRDRRKGIFGVLGKQGFAHEQAVPTLLDALANDDSSEASCLLHSLNEVDWSQSPKPVLERAVTTLSQLARSGCEDTWLWRLLPDLMAYSPSARHVVCQSLSHDSPIVQRSVADRLRYTSEELPEEVVAALKQMLEHEDTSVRLAAVRTLSAKAVAADTWVAAARRLLEDKDEDVRLAIAPILWKQNRDWGEVGAIIVEALKKDGWNSPRDDAIRALLEMPPPVDLLRVHVNDVLAENLRESGVAKAMLQLDAETARSWVPQFIKLLDEESLEERRRFIDNLGELGPHAAAAVPELIEELRFDKDGGDEATARSAANTLGRIGASARPAVPDLEGMLKYYNRQTRHTAAEALGMIGPAAEDAVPELEKAATHLDRLTRLHAQVALTAITGNPIPATNALREAIANRGRWEQEVIDAAPRAISALSEAGLFSDATVRTLKEAAKHPYYDIHQPAREVLDAATKAKD